MEVVDRVLKKVDVLIGTCRVGAALGYYGRYLATEDRLYLRLANQALDEAKGLGANTDLATDFMARYQL